MARDRARKHAVQVRVDPDLLAMIEKAAAVEDEDVGSWLRRLIKRELHPPVVRAWSGSLGKGFARDDGLTRERKIDPVDTFYLRPLRHTDVDREYIVYRDELTPLSPFVLQERTHFWNSILSGAGWIFIQNAFAPFVCTHSLTIGGVVHMTLKRAP